MHDRAVVGTHGPGFSAYRVRKYGGYRDRDRAMISAQLSTEINPKIRPNFWSYFWDSASFGPKIPDLHLT